MRKKTIIVAVLAATLTLSSVFSSFAGQWIQDERGWKYVEYDGTFVHTEMKTEYESIPYYYEDIGILGKINVEKQVEPLNRISFLNDRNGDGIAEEYFFDLDGYLITDSEVKNVVFIDCKVDSNGATLDAEGNVITKLIPQGEVKSEIGRGVLQDQYVNLLMQNLQTVDARLGTNVENRSYSSSGLYISKYISNTAIGLTLINDKVCRINGWAKDIFIDANMSVSTMDTLLGVQHNLRAEKNLLGNNVYFYEWTIQENPKVVISMRDSNIPENRTIDIMVNP